MGGGKTGCILWYKNLKIGHHNSVVLKGWMSTFDGHFMLHKMLRTSQLQKLATFLENQGRASTFGCRFGPFWQHFIHTTSVPGNCRASTLIFGFHCLYSSSPTGHLDSSSPLPGFTRQHLSASWLTFCQTAAKEEQEKRKMTTITPFLTNAPSNAPSGLSNGRKAPN
jgi:hypothetical protein